MNFYKHHLGDYMKRTQFFSMAQHGAYRLMIDYCYINEGPLPKKKAMIYEICKASTKANKQDVDAVLQEKWVLDDDGYHNDRIDDELEIYRTKAAKNKANGNLGGRPKITQTVIKEETQNKPNDNLSQNPESSNQKNLTPLSESSIPDCPQAELLTLYAEALPMLTQPAMWEGARADAMRARWKQCAKANGISPGYATKADGIAFWRKFFGYVAESPKLTEGIQRKEGGAWKPDLPWLLKLENFAKVIEGKFHS